MDIDEYINMIEEECHMCRCEMNYVQKEKMKEYLLQTFQRKLCTKNIDKIVSWNENYNRYPICVAKTQYSISDKPELGTTPNDYVLDVKDVYLDGGAEFIVVLTGDIMTMPGLPKEPSAEKIDVLSSGKIVGLF